MAKRTSISKKTRFDVFKRDSFKCQYCGNHPPKVILHVDHINPVANGGKNDPDNLLTSCESCNLGKGARLLTAVPESLRDKAARIAEVEAQLLGYQAVLEAQRGRIEDDLWRVADLLDPDNNGSIPGEWAGSIRRFNDRIGLHQVLDAAQIAIDRWGIQYKTWSYFCGVCWRKIRELESA
jgi:hypothetical protein